MREQGRCSNCRYPIERERTIRPILTALPIPPLTTELPDKPIAQSIYEQEETIRYYADGKTVFACPGCNAVLLTGDALTDKTSMDLARLEQQIRKMS